MLTQDTILRTLRAHYEYLLSEFGVSRIGIFGSWAQGNPDDDSDIDFLAEFEETPGLEFMELAQYLESLFGRSVDILTPGGIAAIRNPRIAKNIRQSVIYA